MKKTFWAEGGCGRCAVTDDLLRQIDGSGGRPLRGPSSVTCPCVSGGSENQRIIDMKTTLRAGSAVLWEET
ncbi:hypothetical protein [Ruthenibacterium lactatiformans]|uniref:hypothetical protein n=1 Tax=Ruthenibacterium lactatiformans TaxID=1550024 RepID=UPI003522867C